MELRRSRRLAGQEPEYETEKKGDDEFCGGEEVQKNGSKCTSMCVLVAGVMFYGACVASVLAAHATRFFV